jgi:hypothetical protein
MYKLFKYVLCLVICIHVKFCVSVLDNILVLNNQMHSHRLVFYIVQEYFPQKLYFSKVYFHALLQFLRVIALVSLVHYYKFVPCHVMFTEFCKYGERLYGILPWHNLFTKFCKNQLK